jgi:hypothetical protein
LIFSSVPASEDTDEEELAADESTQLAIIHSFDDQLRPSSPPDNQLPVNQSPLHHAGDGGGPNSNSRVQRGSRTAAAADLNLLALIDTPPHKDKARDEGQGQFKQAALVKQLNHKECCRNCCYLKNERHVSHSRVQAFLRQHRRSAVSQGGGRRGRKPSVGGGERRGTQRTREGMKTAANGRGTHEDEEEREGNRQRRRHDAMESDGQQRADSAERSRSGERSRRPDDDDEESSGSEDEGNDLVYRPVCREWQKTQCDKFEITLVQATSVRHGSQSQPMRSTSSPVTTPVDGDGNCLFRTLAHILCGDQVS